MLQHLFRAAFIGGYINVLNRGRFFRVFLVMGFPSRTGEGSCGFAEIPDAWLHSASSEIYFKIIQNVVVDSNLF
jgi:hypothetical protein